MLKQHTPMMQTPNSQGYEPKKKPRRVDVNRGLLAGFGVPARGYLPNYPNYLHAPLQRISPRWSTCQDFLGAMNLVASMLSQSRQSDDVISMLTN